MEIQNIRVTGTVDINGSSKNGILMDTLALRARFGSLAVEYSHYSNGYKTLANLIV